MIADAILSGFKASQDILQSRCYQEILLLQAQLLALKKLKCNKQQI